MQQPPPQQHPPPHEPTDTTSRAQPDPPWLYTEEFPWDSLPWTQDDKFEYQVLPWELHDDPDPNTIDARDLDARLRL